MAANAQANCSLWRGQHINNIINCKMPIYRSTIIIQSIYSYVHNNDRGVGAGGQEGQAPPKRKVGGASPPQSVRVLKLHA